MSVASFNFGWVVVIGEGATAKTPKTSRLNNFWDVAQEIFPLSTALGKTSVLIAYSARKDEKCRKFSDDLGEMQQNFRSMLRESTVMM